MNNVLTIDTRELTEFANRLANLSKTALPNVVRKTLNDAAMDVKKTTMPESSHVFTQRQQNFFTANSRVEFAKSSSSISNMQSSVGFMEKGLKGENNYSVKDLEQQEKGGTITNKSFIPLDTARTSKSNSKSVKANLRLTAIDRIIHTRNQKGKNKKEKFIRAVIRAGVGGFVLGSDISGENILWRVNSVSQNLKTRKLDITPLYNYRKGRSIKVSPTHFMEKASEKTTKKMEKFFIINAEERFKRVLKK